MSDPKPAKPTRTIKVPVTLIVGKQPVPPMTPVTLDADEAAALLKRYGGHTVQR